MINRKAFTLVEAIVVAVIVAILASVGIPILTGYLNDARLDSGRGSIELVGAAIMATHNRGATIDANDWTDLGITDPSDDTWTFTFPQQLLATADPANYAITATCKKGSLKGKPGTYSPNQAQGSRWTGVFECFDK
jgi:prepilin-type N-terminal cleavage/methylation domain-containing protein